MREDAAAIAREVLDGNLYMTLATADAAGRPWATPVFFTADGPTRFYWVSSPMRATRATSPSGRRWASSSSTRRSPSAAPRPST